MFIYDPWLNKRKINIDDIITEYMLYRVDNDYDSSITLAELMKFLEFAIQRIDMEFEPYTDGLNLMAKYYYTKYKNGVWVEDGKFVPHINLTYDEETGIVEVKANKKLNDKDSSFSIAPATNDIEKLHFRRVCVMFLNPKGYGRKEELEGPVRFKY